MTFYLNTRKFAVRIIKHWNRLPREIVEFVCGGIRNLRGGSPGEPPVVGPA